MEGRWQESALCRRDARALEWMSLHGAPEWHPDHPREEAGVVSAGDGAAIARSQMFLPGVTKVPESKAAATASRKPGS